MIVAQPIANIPTHKKITTTQKTRIVSSIMFPLLSLLIGEDPGTDSLSLWQLLEHQRFVTAYIFESEL
jgi:hypothetical protein